MSFVLRVYPGYPDDGAMCRAEAVSLEALAATTVPAPGVWWSDPEGTLFGAPATAIEFIRGAVPSVLDSGVYREIAGVLALLHRQRSPRGLARSMRMPPPGVTSSLAQCVDEEWPGLSAEDDCFLHGDLCAANTLFCEGRIAALIDWSHAFTGPPSLDVAAIWLDGELFGAPGLETRRSLHTLMPAVTACPDSLALRRSTRATRKSACLVISIDAVAKEDPGELPGRETALAGRRPGSGLWHAYRSQ